MGYFATARSGASVQLVHLNRAQKLTFAALLLSCFSRFVSRLRCELICVCGDLPKTCVCLKWIAASVASAAPEWRMPDKSHPAARPTSAKGYATGGCAQRNFRPAHEAQTGGSQQWTERYKSSEQIDRSIVVRNDDKRRPPLVSPTVAAARHANNSAQNSDIFNGC